MTKEEMMAIIRDRAKRNADEAKAKLNAEQMETKKLQSEIRLLEDRIDTIIVLANECVNNGIKIPHRDRLSSYYDSAKEYGYNAEFIAEGIHHHTGLIGYRKYETTPFVWLGIYNGGACGKYDFYTNGSQSFSCHEDTYEESAPRICDMKQFLEEFPVFEAAFFNWISSMKGE